MSKENKNFQIRAFYDEEKQKRYISGYAVVFNQLSKKILENGKTFNEKIFDTAINDNTRMDNVLMLLNHKKSNLLARTKSGTLQWEKDENGIYITFEVPDTTLGNDVYEQVRLGNYSEMSFGFYLDPKNSDDAEFIKDQGMLIRHVKNIKMITEISIVTDGAYPQTNIQLGERSLDEIEAELDKEQVNYNIKNKQKELEILKIK